MSNVAVTFEVVWGENLKKVQLEGKKYFYF
jgi:hypothetical protein